MLVNLNRNSSRVHFEKAIYADTPSNIHLSHEERLKMTQLELVQLNLKDVEESDDIYIYTTYHAHCVLKI